jgi:hypothetical protein
MVGSLKLKRFPHDRIGGAGAEGGRAKRAHP